jgi:hypothetical protein
MILEVGETKTKDTFDEFYWFVLFTGSAAGGAMPRPIFPPELRA